MSDLTEFLSARIAEDEAVARAAHEGPWEREDDQVRMALIPATSQTRVRANEWLCDSISDADAEHIARYDPPRVLAECEAKRRIVEAAADYSPELEHGDNGEWAFGIVLRLLALPYVEHPDFREEWRA